MMLARLAIQADPAVDEPLPGSVKPGGLLVNRPATWLVWLLAASPLGSGCSWWNHPRPQLDSMAGLYDRASIVYRLDASQLCEPLAVARIEGQLVAYQELPTAPVANSAVGTLTIKYPHPAGVPNCALAEVVIETRKPDGP